MMGNNTSINYSKKFRVFMVKCEHMYNEQFPNAMDELKSLYIPLFQIMDEAKKKNIHCNIKEIMNTTMSKLFMLPLLSLSDADVNELIIELQNDVDMILEKGFYIFEEKIINMFIEFEEYNNTFANLMQKFDNLHESIQKFNIQQTK